MISIFSVYVLSFSKGFIKKCFYIKLAFMFLVLFSQSSNASDLLEIYKMACENDATYQSEIYRHEASPEIYKQAFSEMLPLVSVDGFYQYSRHEIFDTDIAVYGDDLARYPSKGFDLVLSQPVIKYPSMVRISQAKEEIKRADLDFEAAGQDLIMRVTEAYLYALEARDVLQFSKAEEEAVRLHFQLAKERYDNGLAPITDYHDAKARLASITTKRIKAENSLEDALEGIAEITGERMDSLESIGFPDIKTDDYYDVAGSDGERTDDPETGEDTATVSNEKSLFNGLAPRESGKYAGAAIPLIKPFPEDIEEWVSAAKKQNLKVLVKEKDLEVAKKEVERQVAGRLPSVSLVGRWNRDYQGGSLFGGQSDTEKWEGILEVKVPLFKGFSVSSKVREARLMVKAAEKELEKEIRLVTRESKAAYLGIISSIDNIQALKQAMVSNQIALEAKKEGFKSGLFPSLAVTDAERDLYQTKQEYAKSQYDYILNSLRLKRAVGLLKESDINTINSWLN